MRVRVDEDKCQGHNRCAALAPERFEIEDWGTANARNGGAVLAERGKQARLAVANCPRVRREHHRRVKEN